MTKYVLTESDYLDLYKFFQSRADELKSNMFANVTWVLGFAAAVLGFVVGKFVSFKSTGIEIVQVDVALASCFVGALLCVYAILLLREAAAHIRGNWERSGACEKYLDGLDAVIKAARSRPQLGQIWHRIGFVVVLFLCAFVALAALLIKWSAG